MPGKSDGLLVGLSMGTTKTTIIVAEYDPSYPDSVHVIGLGNARSNGISKGILVSIPEARQSIKEAFRDVQSITGIPSRRLNQDVIVAFNAMDIENEMAPGWVSLGGRDPNPVEVSHLDRVIDVARNRLKPSGNMYPLHTIPVQYVIDNQPVEDPLNMNGMRLDMTLLTVSVPRAYIQNVVNCVQSAGIEIKGLLLKPLASAMGAVTEEEMRAGCISICIGGGMTGIVLYQGGRAFRVMSIPIGGKHITSDLSAVLHLSLREAEILKKRIFYENEEDLQRARIDVETASQVILARIEELFSDYVRTALAECNPQLFPGGVILSGGVSYTPGIDLILADILQMPVRRALQTVYTMPPELDEASYVSAAGILKYFSATEHDPYLFVKSNQEIPGLIERPGRAASERRERIQDRLKQQNNEEIYEEEDNGTEEDYYEEDDYDDYEEEGGSTRETLSNFLSSLSDRLKKLF